MRLSKNKYPEKQTDLELRSILTGESYPIKKQWKKSLTRKWLT